MNDEIKIILDYLELYKNLEEGLLSAKDRKMLLDYITNLQQENEMLKINKVVNIANYVKDMADYKSRCEKAVEYIEQFCDRNEEVIDAFNFDYSYNHIIDILRGDTNVKD